MKSPQLRKSTSWSVTWKVQSYTACWMTNCWHTLCNIFLMWQQGFPYPNRAETSSVTHWPLGPDTPVKGGIADVWPEPPVDLRLKEAKPRLSKGPGGAFSTWQTVRMIAIGKTMLCTGWGPQIPSTSLHIQQKALFLPLSYTLCNAACPSTHLGKEENTPWTGPWTLSHNGEIS